MSTFSKRSPPLSLEQKNDDAAIQYLRSRRESGSTSPQTYEQLGNLLVRTKRYPEAQKCSNRAIKLLPYDALLYRLLSVSYLSLHKNAEAGTLLRQARVKFFRRIRAASQAYAGCRSGRSNSERSVDVIRCKSIGV